MASKNYPNRHQYEFLRKLREHAYALPQDAWPPAATLKRWMRRKGFRRTFKRLIATFRNEADYVTAGAATRAAHRLHRLMVGIDDADGADNLAKYDKQIEQCLRVLRLDRQRVRDKFAGEAARSRTLAYKDWFERRKSPLWSERNELRSQLNQTTYLLQQLKDYWKKIERPFVPQACMSAEIVAHLRQREAEELERLEKDLREAGLIPSGAARVKPSPAQARPAGSTL